MPRENRSPSHGFRVLRQRTPQFSLILVFHWHLKTWLVQLRTSTSATAFEMEVLAPLIKLKFPQEPLWLWSDLLIYTPDPLPLSSTPCMPFGGSPPEPLACLPNDYFPFSFIFTYSFIYLFILHKFFIFETKV